MSNGTKPTWRPVTSSVPQGSMLGVIPFNAFINDLDGGPVRTHSKFAKRVVLPSRKDLNRLEKWPNRNLIKFNKEKCKILHLERNHHRHYYILGDPSWKAAWQKKTWESWWVPS